MQTFLSELQKTGNEVITRKIHKTDDCPLCLQAKNILELQNEIKVRLDNITESSKKKLSFDNSKESINRISIERSKRLDSLTINLKIDDPLHKNIKYSIENLKRKFDIFQKASIEKVTSGNKIPELEEVKFHETDFKVIKEISEKISSIKTAISNENTTVIYSNISSAKDAFMKIKAFEKEKEKLENQKNTLEIIYTELVAKQKEGLQHFIDTFSESINEFYQYMNPSELFDDIRIETIGEDDDLNGITIKYKYKGEWVFPPQKYFSESHLNCFGISYFLASVIAFNKENKFLFFDDVISSFDSNHRKKIC